MQILILSFTTAVGAAARVRQLLQLTNFQAYRNSVERMIALELQADLTRSVLLGLNLVCIICCSFLRRYADRCLTGSQPFGVLGKSRILYVAKD
jgi:hypothetical protein